MESLTPVDATGISLAETVHLATVRRDSNEIILAASAYRQVRDGGGKMLKYDHKENRFCH